MTDHGRRTRHEVPAGPEVPDPRPPVPDPGPGEPPPDPAPPPPGPIVL